MLTVDRALDPVEEGDSPWCGYAVQHVNKAGPAAPLSLSLVELSIENLSVQQIICLVNQTRWDWTGTKA